MNKTIQNEQVNNHIFEKLIKKQYAGLYNQYAEEVIIKLHTNQY